MAEKKEKGLTGWSSSGSLIIGDAGGGISMQVQMDEAGYFTLQYDIDLPQPGVGGIDPAQLILPRAEVIWTTAGNKVRRLINVGKGSAISGAGNNVVSRLTDYSVLTGVTPANTPYAVSQQCALGVRPTNPDKPPILNTFTNIANTDGDVRGSAGHYVVVAGGSRDIIIPRDAGVVSFYSDFRVGLGGGSIVSEEGINSITFTSAGATILDSFNKTGFNAWHPLHPAAGVIRFLNFEAFNIEVNVIWGIEG